MSLSLPCTLPLFFPHWISAISWHRCDLSTSLQTGSLLTCSCPKHPICVVHEHSKYAVWGLDDSWKYQTESYPQQFCIFPQEACFGCGQTVTFSSCSATLYLSCNFFILAVFPCCAYERDSPKSLTKSGNVTSLALLLSTRPAALWQKEIKLIWQDLFSTNPY